MVFRSALGRRALGKLGQVVRDIALVGVSAQAGLDVEITTPSGTQVPFQDVEIAFKVKENGIARVPNSGRFG